MVISDVNTADGILPEFIWCLITSLQPPKCFHYRQSPIHSLIHTLMVVSCSQAALGDTDRAIYRQHWAV